MRGCLEPNELLDFGRRTLAATEQEAIAAHLTGCIDCRTLVSAFARRTGENPPTLGLPPDPQPLPAPTTHVGRYEIVGALGSGAMGIVYRAWDPELNRQVAIKLVRTEVATPEVRAVIEARE